MEYNFEVPRPRSLGKAYPQNANPNGCGITDQNGDSACARDIILHMLIARIASENNTTTELFANYSNSTNTVEVELSEEILQSIESINIGSNMQRYMAWVISRDDLLTEIYSEVADTLEDYYTKEEVADTLEDYYTKEELDALSYDHQGLSNLLGGTNNEMYHLTSAQHTNLTGANTTLQNLTVSSDLATQGDIVYESTFWDDLAVPVTSAKTGGANDPDFSMIMDNGAGSVGTFAYLFNPIVEESLFFQVQMPHRWKIGTNIKAHAHWMPPTDGEAGQTVSWGLEYTWVSIGNVASNTTIVYGNQHTPADATLVSKKHYITPIVEIDGTGKGLSSMLLCRIFRNTGGDDYGDDAALLEVDFHYQIDSVGSSEEYVK